MVKLCNDELICRAASAVTDGSPCYALLLNATTPKRSTQKQP